jgi:serine/threonine-protein kinase
LENDLAERGQISRFALEFDENGFISSLRYTNRDGKFVCDKENIYGKRYERDGKGRVKTEYYLAQNDSVISTSWGLGVKEFKYENDNLVEAVYLSPDGSPSFDDSDGVSIYTMEYDDWGNNIRALHKSSDRKPMITKKQGIAGIKNTFNNEGQIVEQCYLGTDDKLMHCVSAGCAGIKIEYNENGYVKQQTFIDETGNPVNNDVLGGTIIKYEPDPNGNLLIEEHLDANRQPYETLHGYAKIVAKYDSLGNQTEVFHYDKKDALCLVDIDMDGINDEVAGIKYEYNDRNKVIKETYYGTNNQPKANNNKVTVAIREYDDSGNFLQSMRYCQADGTLTLSTEGIAGWKAKYKDGFEVEREFFDKQENITSCTDGYAKWTNSYENGLIKEISFLDKYDNLVVCQKIVIDGREYKYAGVKFKYDGRGNCIEEFYYNAARRLATPYIERCLYDNYGNKTERSYYDANGNKTFCTNGYFKLKSVYNDKHQEIEVRAYDKNDNLIMSSSLGYAVAKADYDSKKGFITKFSMFNTAEKLLSYTKQEYDVRGNVTEKRYYTSDNNLKQDNCAIERYKYDKQGQLTEYAMYNYLDKTDNFNGWHKYTLEYDAQRVPTYQKYYNTNNKLLAAYRYNQKEGKWEEIGAPNIDWQQYWRNSVANCPFPVDYGIMCTSITPASNGCTLQIQFTGVAKHQQTSDELENCKNFARQLASKVKKDSQMPSSATLTVVGVDKDKSELFRITQ